MNLHGRIMSLNCILTNMDAEPAQRLAYKVGHRDARHAAAELAMLGDACAAALHALLERYTDLVNCGDCGNWNPEREDQVIAARAALAAVGEA